jgi:hypothetical protein
MDSETQARVFAAAVGGLLQPVMQRTSGLSKGEWVCETCRVIQWEGAVHVVADGRCLGAVPDLLTWAGCGALLDAMRAKPAWYDIRALAKGYRCKFWAYSGNELKWHGRATALALPLAVARAAASALGVEVR